jgi:hypothetical protein
MTRTLAWSVTAAALVSAVHVAPSRAQEIEIEDTPISLVGCVMREIDYRRQHDAARGGFLGLGGGLGDEYILVNATRGTAGPSGDCGTATGGEAYELSGSGEEAVEAFVGQRVVLTGILKEADIDPATGRPTGGNDAAGELRLFEVNVETVRAYVPPEEPPAPVAVLEERPTDAPVVVEQPVATTGVQEPPQQLPRTASGLALVGLIGLFSLGGAAAFRLARQQARRARAAASDEF